MCQKWEIKQDSVGGYLLISIEVNLNRVKYSIFLNITPGSLHFKILSSMQSHISPMLCLIVRGKLKPQSWDFFIVFFFLLQNTVKWAPALIQRIEEEKICRICRLNSTKLKEELISPCSCKGTLAHIHRTCLEKWLKRSGTTYCELCRYNYTVKVIER